MESYGYLDREIFSFLDSLPSDPDFDIGEGPWCILCGCNMEDSPYIEDGIAGYSTFCLDCSQEQLINENTGAY